MLKKVKTMTIYSFCHFLVDFVSCIFVLGVAPGFCFNSEGEFVNTLYIAEVIMYNFFAFAFQVPMGYLMDKAKIYKYVGIIGFALIGLCYVMGPANPVLLSSLVGIGNGLFHLEGGVNAFNESKGKAFLNGLFVAPGTMGIFLGTFFYEKLAITYWPIALIFLAIFLLIFVQNDKVEFVEQEQEKITKNGRKFGIEAILTIALLIGISIIVRSIGGSAIKYEWKTGLAIGAIYSTLVMLGKAFGGFIGDRLSLKGTAIISLALACVSLIIGFTTPFFGYIGIFLFNIPMSITLLMLEKSNIKNLATMVGSNTLFLFIGFLICLFPSTWNNIGVLSLSIVFAMISIFCSFKKYEETEEL